MGRPQDPTVVSNVVVDDDDNSPNLDTVDEAFGPHSDLYRDVLRVPSNCSSNGVREAYFQRRNELLKLLGDIDADQEQDSITASHRFHAERKMDAVVMALRILGDDSLRRQYDDLRDTRVLDLPRSEQEQQQPPPPPVNTHHYIMNENEEALKPRRKSKKSSRSKRRSADPHEDLTQSHSMESTSSRTTVESTTTESSRKVSFVHVSSPSDDNDNTPEDLVSPPRNGSKKSKATEPSSTFIPVVVTPNSREEQEQDYRRGRKSPEARDNALDLVAMTTDDEDNNTVGSEFTEGTARTLETVATVDPSKGILARIQDEVQVFFEDTTESLGQVFNAFTLQEEDIRAVVGRIDKAKRQMQKTL